MQPTDSSNRVVLYLQNQSALDQLPACFPGLTAINLSSFHFGYNPDGSPYIHLNNSDPDDPSYQGVLWPLMKQAQAAGVKVIAMLGGAGGAYGRLFSDYETFCPMWERMLDQYGLDGVDLDVEEAVAQADIVRFIADLRAYSSSLLITAAPVAAALSGGSDPLSGINWQPLAGSIDWFNVQFYSGYGSLADTSDYDGIVQAGFSPAQILAGSLTNPANGSGYVPIATVCSTLIALNSRYGGQIGGAMGWEYFNANDPNENPDPVGWVAAMVNGLRP